MSKIGVILLSFLRQSATDDWTRNTRALGPRFALPVVGRVQQKGVENG